MPHQVDQADWRPFHDSMCTRCGRDEGTLPGVDDVAGALEHGWKTLLASFFNQSPECLRAKSHL